MTNQFLWGAAAMACVVIGLFFVRFWKASRDRLFLIFGVAFWVLAMNWIGLAVSNPPDDSRHYLYVVRLLAFLLIIGGIVDKNRASRRK